MSEPANSDDLYVVLGVEPSASQVEIRRAYLQQSRLTHPDKEGGSTEAFLALKFALLQFFQIHFDDVPTTRKGEVRERQAADTHRQRQRLRRAMWSSTLLHLQRSKQKPLLFFFFAYLTSLPAGVGRKM